jgi:hypothetical protein
VCFGHLRSVRRHADRLELDHTHFTGQRRWTDDQLAAAIASASTWSQVAEALKLSGGSITVTIRGHAVRLGLDTTHLVRGGTLPPADGDLNPQLTKSRPGRVTDSRRLVRALWSLCLVAAGAVCHDLLTRVEDQAALLASLAGVLTEGGVLSLGFANRDWLALRAGRRGDHTSALRLVEGGGGAGGLMPRPPTDGGSEAITLDEATQQLDKAGLALVAAQGVGVFAEVGDEDLGRAELAALVELERLVAGREPYRSSARTLHLIARRRVFRPDLTGDSL